MKNSFTTFFFLLCTSFCSVQAQLTTNVMVGLTDAHGVTILGNDIYVSDEDADQILKSDKSATNMMGTLVVTLDSPLDMLVYNDELLVATSTGIVKIDVLSANPSITPIVTPNTRVSGLYLNNTELFYSEQSLGKVMKIDLANATPMPTQVAEGFSFPSGIALSGNRLFVTEVGAQKISTVADITGANLVPTTFVGGLNQPFGLVLDGDYLYTAEIDGLVRININESTPTANAIAGVSLVCPAQIMFENGIMYVGDESAAKKIEAITPNFDDLSTVCGNLTATTIIGGASPTGGVYSGSGISDDGNGETFTINPSSLGAGNYTITYTLAMNTADAQIEVLAAPNVSFTAGLPDLPQNAGIQTDLSGGSPVGGIYGGPGVTDDGNGMTYAFNPATAGAGTHTITYSFTDGNGCQGVDSDMVTVTQVLSFNDLPSVCEDEVSVTGMGGFPTGGVYSGTGVTDLGNGQSFTFDVAGQGPGIYTINYTVSGGSVTAQLEVWSNPVVTFSTALPELFVNAGVQSNEGGGMPTGGVYSGPGVTNAGNGMTFSFDPAVAGVGTHTITYTYTDNNGCSASATDEVNVKPQELNGDKCDDPIDINGQFGQMVEVPQVSDSYNTAGYGTNSSDPTSGFECHFESDVLQNTIWYSFMGDGDRYLIRSIACMGSTDNFDTEVAIYSGECANLTAVACNEDEDENASLFNISLELDTEDGVNYLMMMDTYQGAQGSFCLEITRLTDVAVVNINGTELSVYPNPTSALIQLPAIQLDRIEVYDVNGRMVMSEESPGTALQFRDQSSGLYLLKMFDKENVYSAKVIKE